MTIAAEKYRIIQRLNCSSNNFQPIRDALISKPMEHRFGVIRIDGICVLQRRDSMPRVACSEIVREFGPKFDCLKRNGN